VRSLEVELTLMLEQLSNEQRNAVEAFEMMERKGSGGVLRVEALAGSGKTSVAVALIASWYRCTMRNGGVGSGRLLIPAFTRAAVKELNARLGRLMSVEERARLIIGTFDSLLRKLLRDVGLLNDGNLVNRRRELDLLNYRLAGQLLAISGQNPRKLLTQGIEALGAGRSVPALLEKVGFSEVWTHLLADVISNGCIPEDGIREVVSRNIGAITELLQRHPDWGVTHVLIDEDQDCSAGDLLLPLEVVRRGGGLVLLGDANQAIMSFRGGLGDVTSFLHSKNISVQTVTCTVNFRSTGALVRAQNAFRLDNRMTGPDALVPRRALGGLAPAVIVAPDATSVVEFTYRLIRGLLDGEVGSLDRARLGNNEMLQEQVMNWRGGKTGAVAAKDIGLLVPVNQVGKELDRALKERGINTRFERAPSNPYRGGIAELAIAWLTKHDRGDDLVTRMNQILILSDALGKWFPPGEKSECIQASAKFRRAYIERFGDPSVTNIDCVSTAWECFAVIHNEDSSSRGIARLERLLSSFQSGGDDTCGRLESLSEILPGLRVTSSIRGKGPVVIGQHGSLPVAFRLLMDKKCPAEEVSNILDRASVQFDQSDPAEQDENVVVLRTIHRSKGLGFKAVIVVRSDLIGQKHARRPFEESNHDCCVAYVAATRATSEHYEIALDKPNRFHQHQLDGWRYFGSH